MEEHTEQDYIMWASAHKPSLEQRKQLWETGKIELLEENELSLFEEITNLKLESNLKSLAQKLADIAMKPNVMLVQPAGSPALQFELGVEMTLKVLSEYTHEKSIEFIRQKVQLFRPRYAFSKRISQDIPQEDGSVKKVSTFKHEDFI